MHIFESLSVQSKNAIIESNSIAYLNEIIVITFKAKNPLKVPITMKNILIITD